jgi:hypothetical protein
LPADDDAAGTTPARIERKGNANTDVSLQDVRSRSAATAIVAGWGVLDIITRAISPSLHFVEVPIQDNSVCRRVEPTLSNMNLCAGGELGKASRPLPLAPLHI